MTTADPSASALTVGENPTEAPVRRRRTVLWIMAAVLVVVIAAGAILAIQYLPGTPVAATDAQTPASTEPVTIGTMVAATNVKGTLHFAQSASVLSSASGVLTEVPVAGTVITTGGALYRVNNSPVVLLRGSLPAWRTFAAGMDDGPDVAQLEQNLTALGLFDGTVDAHFSYATFEAVKAFQTLIGVARTGSIDYGTVYFAAGDIRVAQVSATLGATINPSTEVYKTSTTGKVVDVAMRLADQQLAVVGAPVTIVLPDGTETAGKVISVGQPTEQAPDPTTPVGVGAGTAGFVVPVTIALDDPAATDAFPQASVTARFSTTLSENALTVPVEALVAVDAKTFAVELPKRDSDGRFERITVVLGGFSSGRVAVTGPGITGGTLVVVPTL